MRAVMLVKTDGKSEGMLPPDNEVVIAIGKFNDEMQKAGVMVAGEGLLPSSHGARVRLAHGKFSVTDGPFSEAKELVGGLWLIQTKTREQAVSWLERVPLLEDVELRPLYEMDDFPVGAAEQPDGWRDREIAARDAMTNQAPPRTPGTKRFILLLKSDARTESGALPTEETLSEMGALMDEGVRSGALLGGEGLKPSSTGVRLRGKGSARRTLDGPFTESKELIAGYTILQCETKTLAVEFAKRWLAIHAKVGVDECEIEVRELLDAP